MIKINDKNYLIDNHGNKTDKFIPDETGIIIGDKHVDPENMFINYGGYICAIIDGKTVSIDYPYYNKLVKAGYVVFRDYDKERVDIEEGYYIRGKVLNTVLKATNELISEMPNFEIKENTYIIRDKAATHSIHLSTVDSIVSKNISRRDNNLKFYPYDKNVDRFGCVYMAIFEEPNTGKANSKFANQFVKRLIGKLPEYHFYGIPVKSRIIDQTVV